MEIEWRYDISTVNWQELSELYRTAPLGAKKPEDLQLVFGNSMFHCFVYTGPTLVGAGRALADGRDCSYLCDIAVHPHYQARGIGKAIVSRLIRLSSGHNKIMLYSSPGKDGFYKGLGFRRLTTGMAIFEDQQQAIADGLVEKL